MKNTTSDPPWWTSVHANAWDRTKVAIQRDWEQTKRDLGGMGRGTDLNQDASDTLRQASGRSAVPPLHVANVPDDGDVHRRQVAMDDANFRVKNLTHAANAAEPGTARSSKKQKRADHAREEVVTADAELHEASKARYADAERALRYGVGASMHHGHDWRESEAAVRVEWSGLNPDRPWAEVRDDVHAGWNRGRGHLAA